MLRIHHRQQQRYVDDDDYGVSYSHHLHYGNFDIAQGRHLLVCEVPANHGCRKHVVVAGAAVAAVDGGMHFVLWTLWNEIRQQRHQF